jgi:sugar phosphate isomerase/epimerase
MQPFEERDHEDNQRTGNFSGAVCRRPAPFNTLEGMAKWAAGLGFTGIQIPSWDGRLFDLKQAAESQGYCDEILGVVSRAGLAVTELSTHLQGQLVASHPAFDTLLEGFAPPSWRRI